MHNYAYLQKYFTDFFSKWETFQKNVVEEIYTHI